MRFATPTAPQLLGSRRAAGAAVPALLAAAAGGALVAPAQAAPAALQRLAVLEHDGVARTRPSVHADRIETVAARRPLTHVRTILPVLGTRTSADGHTWLQVGLPGRPSGHTGWIAADRTRRTSTPWYLSVRLSARTVTVWHAGQVERRFRAVVGKAATPTPRGRFFVEEAVALSRRDAGGPFALASSARSSVLQEFDGGPGQIALHGIEHLAGAPGTAASHGCVRLGTRAITWLARRIGAGVPVTITQ